jgi:hypothetical protein
MRLLRGCWAKLRGLRASVSSALALANRANMANIHVDTGEGDFTNHAPAADWLGDAF